MPERDKCIAPKHWYACVSGVRTDLMPFILDLVPKGPEAVDNAESTPFNTPITIPVIDNDLPGDFPIDPAATIESSPPSNGSIVVNPDGTIEYTPNTDFHGEDTFSYCIFDTEGNKAIANVVVTVMVNPPTATPDVEVAPFETPITISVVDNDILGDLSIDPTQTVLSGNPPPASQGTVSVDPVTGEITFTPAVGFSGSVDQFSYCIFDTAGNKSISTVDITVESENTVVAIDDGPFDLPQGGTITFNKTANDSDPEGDTFAITEIDGQPVANAPFTIGGLTITDNGDGTCNATAPSDQPVAPVVFEYTIQDSNGNTDTAEVTINVTEAATFGFYLDGEDSSVLVGGQIKSAFANGDPVGFSDGNGGVTVIADLAALQSWAETMHGPGSVVDPGTCTVRAEDGSTTNVPICIPETGVCANLEEQELQLADQTVISGDPQNDAMATYTWDEGYEFVINFSKDISRNNLDNGNLVTADGGILVSSPGVISTGNLGGPNPRWYGNVNFDLTRKPTIGGCAAKYRARFEIFDIDTRPGFLLGNDAHSVIPIQNNGGHEWVNTPPMISIANPLGSGFAYSNSESSGQNGVYFLAWSNGSKNAGIAGNDLTGSPNIPNSFTEIGTDSNFNFDVQAVENIGFRFRIWDCAPAVVTTLCGVPVSGVDKDGNDLTQDQLDSLTIE